MSRLFRSTSLCALAALTLLAPGCGSDGSSTSLAPASGGFNNFQNPGTQVTALQAKTFATVLQATVAQGVGALLEISRFTAPLATGNRTFDPNIEVDLSGDYRLTRKGPQADGSYRLEIFRKSDLRLEGVVVAAPTVRTANGFSQSVILGPEVFSQTRDGYAGFNQVTQRELFFGFVGEAVLEFDNDGRLLNMRLIDLRYPGLGDNRDSRTVVRTSTGLLFEEVSGTLTREGDRMVGNLNFGDTPGFSIDSLITATGAFRQLNLVSTLFGGQGRAFLNSNFNSYGDYSPVSDPVYSSPLVLAPLADPPSPSLLGPNNNQYMTYYAVDGVLTVTLPPEPPSSQPTVRSFDLLNAKPLNSSFGPIELPAGARLIVRTGPPSPVRVDTRLTVTVYAVNSVGKAVPFNTNGFLLTSSNPQVLRVTDQGQDFQVRAVGAGTATLTLTDPNSGQSGTVQVTVQDGNATSTGFVYVSDRGNSRIVRFRYNPTSPALPTDRTEIATGHAPLRILISSDKSTLMAENTDNTLQIFSINQSNGNLTERSAETLSVTGLAQAQLDPALFYGNSGSPNQIKEFRFNSANGTLTFQRNLRQGSSSRLVTGLINAGQYVYGSFQNTIHSVDVATATSRDVTMGSGEIVSDLAVTGSTLQVLLRRSLGGGAFEGTLRSFPLNNDGTLNTPASRNITVQSDASGLVVNGGRAYSGVFATGQAVNGVQVAADSLTHLPGQPYPVSGTPTRLATQGNLLFVGTNPENKLETLIIGADGSLSTVGAVDVGGTPTDVKAVTLP